MITEISGRRLGFVDLYDDGRALSFFGCFLTVFLTKKRVFIDHVSVVIFTHLFALVLAINKQTAAYKDSHNMIKVVMPDLRHLSNDSKSSPKPWHSSLMAIFKR